MTRIYRPATYRKRMGVAKEALSKVKDKQKSCDASLKKMANIATLLTRRAGLKGAKLAAFNDKHRKYLGNVDKSEVSSLHRKLSIRSRSLKKAKAVLDARIERLTKQLAQSIKHFGE